MVEMAADVWLGTVRDKAEQLRGGDAVKACNFERRAYLAGAAAVMQELQPIAYFSWPSRRSPTDRYLRGAWELTRWECMPQHCPAWAQGETLYLAIGRERIRRTISAFPRPPRVAFQAIMVYIREYHSTEAMRADRAAAAYRVSSLSCEEWSRQESQVPGRLLEFGKRLQLLAESYAVELPSPQNLPPDGQLINGFTF